MSDWRKSKPRRIVEFVDCVKANGIRLADLRREQVFGIDAKTMLDLIESAYSVGRAETETELAAIVAFDPLAALPGDSER